MNRWNKVDDDYLINNYKVCSYRQLSQKLGRSEHGVRNRLKLLKCSAKKHWANWTSEEDTLLKQMYEGGASINDMCATLGRSKAAVRLRANKTLNAFRDDRYLRTEITESNFYYNLKRILVAKTGGAKCCICGYSKHIDLHHKDGNRKNNHRRNIASLCPNCHREVEAGEHQDLLLTCIWWRIYANGRTSEVTIG